MDGLSESANSLLRTDISLATSLDRLHETFTRVHTGVPPSRAQFRRELERHPEVFRIVTPDRGPWRASALGREENSLTHSDGGPAPIVVPMAALRESAPPSPQYPGRLRRSVYWLGARLDDKSARDIARWVCLAHSCARTESRIGSSRVG